MDAMETTPIVSANTISSGAAQAGPGKRHHRALPPLAQGSRPRSRKSTTCAGSRTIEIPHPRRLRRRLGGVWLDGMEITQFTYFQQMGLASADPHTRRDHLRPRAHRDVSSEEGQGVYDLDFNDRVTYGDLPQSSEKQFSAYNFEHADTRMLTRRQRVRGARASASSPAKLPLPAYDCVMRVSHLFTRWRRAARSP